MKTVNVFSTIMDGRKQIDTLILKNFKITILEINLSFLLVQVNLVIRGLFICEFAYSHLKYW